jgi:hypothetical protein
MRRLSMFFGRILKHDADHVLSRDREDSPPFVKIFLRIILMNFRVDCPF